MKRLALLFALAVGCGALIASSPAPWMPASGMVGALGFAVAAVVTRNPVLFWVVPVLLAAVTAALDPFHLAIASGLGIACFVLGVALCIVLFLLGRRGSARVNHVFLLLGAFWLWNVISVIANAGLGNGLKQLVLLGLVFLLFGLLCSRRWHRDDLWWISLVGTLALAAVTVSGVGGIQAQINRGLFLHSNGFAGVMLFMSWFPVALILQSRDVGSRIVVALVLLSSLGMLVTTSSRSAQLSILASLAFFLFLRGGWLQRGVYLFGVLAVAGMAIRWSRSLGEVGLEAVSMSMFGKRAETGRLELWRLLFEHLKQRPVFGHGPGGSFMEYSNGFSAHNVYLQVLFDTGWVGLGLFVALLAAIGLQLAKRARAAGTQRPLATWNLAFWALTLVHGLFEVSFLGNFLPGTFLVWMIWGIAIGSLPDRVAVPFRWTRADAVRAGTLRPFRPTAAAAEGVRCGSPAPA